MSAPSVPAPPELAAALAAGRGEVVLTGPDGQPVGHAMSAEQYQRLRAIVDKWYMMPPTAEQLAAAERRGGSHSMEEVMKLVEEG